MNTPKQESCSCCEPVFHLSDTDKFKIMQIVCAAQRGEMSSDRALVEIEALFLPGGTTHD